MLNALRKSGRAMTVSELALLVLAGRGLVADDKPFLRWRQSIGPISASWPSLGHMEGVKPPADKLADAKGRLLHICYPDEHSDGPLFAQNKKA